MFFGLRGAVELFQQQLVFTDLRPQAKGYRIDILWNVTIFFESILQRCQEAQISKTNNSIDDL